MVYDILESQIKNEIDRSIEKFGVKTYDVSIDADVDLSIKIVLVSDEAQIKALVKISVEIIWDFSKSFLTGRKVIDWKNQVPYERSKAPGFLICLFIRLCFQHVRIL